MSAPTPERIDGWREFVCAHGHRWRAEDKSKQCPSCGTITFEPSRVEEPAGREATDPAILDYAQNIIDAPDEWTPNHTRSELLPMARAYVAAAVPLVGDEAWRLVGALRRAPYSHLANLLAALEDESPSVRVPEEVWRVLDS